MAAASSGGREIDRLARTAIGTEQYRQYDSLAHADERPMREAVIGALDAQPEHV